MNGIAQNIVPSDVQLKCEHVIGLYREHNGLFSIARLGESSELKTYGGIGWRYCPLCGARLIERDGQDMEER